MYIKVLSLKITKKVLLLIFVTLIFLILNIFLYYLEKSIQNQLLVNLILKLILTLYLLLLVVIYQKK